MTEHEKLKKVCDLIGWINYVWIWLDKKTKVFIQWSQRENRKVNVREIIFTPEFMKKLENYCYSNIDKDLNMLKIMIMSNLRDPVQYLYNTLWLNET